LPWLQGTRQCLLCWHMPALASWYFYYFADSFSLWLSYEPDFSFWLKPSKHQVGPGLEEVKGGGRRWGLELACCKLSLDPAASSSCCYHMMDLFSAPYMIPCTAKALREQWHPNLGWVSSILQRCCSKTYNHTMRTLQRADIDLLDRKTFHIWQLWWNWGDISTTEGTQEIARFRKPEGNDALSVMGRQETKHTHSRCSGLADLTVLLHPQTCQQISFPPLSLSCCTAQTAHFFPAELFVWKRATDKVVFLFSFLLWHSITVISTSHLVTTFFLWRLLLYKIMRQELSECSSRGTGYCVQQNLCWCWSIL